MATKDNSHTEGDKFITSYDWRNKIFLNSMKSSLLKDKHNPFSLQVEELLEALSFKNKTDLKLPDKRTLKSWWIGKTRLSQTRAIQLSSIANLKPSEMSPDHQIVSNNDISLPISRHLLSIDARNLEKIKQGDILIEKEKISNCTINAIKRTWSRFIEFYYEEGQPLDFLKQVKGLKLRSASPPINLAHLNSNWYASGLPKNIQNSYSRNDITSMIEFLTLLGSHLSPMSEEELEIWIMDLASLTNACLALQFIRTFLDGRNPFALTQSVAIASTARMLWDNIQDPEFGIKQFALAVPINQRDKFEITLRSARKKYYEVLSTYGLSEESVTSKLYLYETNINPFVPSMISLNGKLHIPSLAQSLR